MKRIKNNLHAERSVFTVTIYLTYLVQGGKMSNDDTPI